MVDGDSFAFLIAMHDNQCSVCLANVNAGKATFGVALIIYSFDRKKIFSSKIER